MLVSLFRMLLHSRSESKPHWHWQGCWKLSVLVLDITYRHFELNRPMTGLAARGLNAVADEGEFEEDVVVVVVETEHRPTGAQAGADV